MAPALTAEELVSRVLAWRPAHVRELPWRGALDPYAVLVSELMLQQTQAARVAPRYEAWLERWPTVESLAAASLAEVIAAWSGLGYNRRAVALHRAARAIAADGWPRTAVGLRTLPGIGPYTAAAIACFAFGADAVPVDVNVRRVLDRAAAGAPVVAPPGGAAALTQALFDLGAAVCIARRPRCHACPLASGCPSRGAVFAPARRQGRFEGSARERRGAILRAAAAGPVAIDTVDAGLAEALARDGLVEISGGVITLPHG